MNLNFKTQEQKLMRVDTKTVAENSVNFLYAVFDFDQSWNGFTKKAVFMYKGEAYSRILTDGRCSVPHEVVHAGAFYVSLIGTSDGGEVRNTSSRVKVDVVQGPELDAQNSSVPTPTEMEQLTDMVGDIKEENEYIKSRLDLRVPEIGDNGNWFINGVDTGASALGEVISNVSINVEGHLIVTFADGRELDAGVAKGADGKDGAKGPQGPEGKQGPQGIQGIPGEKGADGKDGVDGKDGTDGADGSDGRRGTGLLPVTTAPSAYTTAVNGLTPAYRISLSTVKTQSSTIEVYAGDTIRQSYYHYPVIYVDASYVYCGTRVSIRGATGSAGKTPVKGTDYFTEDDKTEMVNAVMSALPTTEGVGF